jgi:hypothetical protein
LPNVGEELTASIIVLMMEAVSTSETLISIYQNTWRNIQEYSRLHTYRRENLKSLLKGNQSLASKAIVEGGQEF